jgi:hypothetical protein
MRRLDQVFRMRHHAEHVARRVHDAGDVVDRAVRVGAFGVAEHDLAVALEPGQRLGIGKIVAVMMGDRAADHLALPVVAGEGGVGVGDSTA